MRLTMTKSNDDGATMATMMVMTIAIKMMMKCRRNKLINTFSRRLDFLFINVVIKNVHIYCTYTSRM